MIDVRTWFVVLSVVIASRGAILQRHGLAAPHDGEPNEHQEQLRESLIEKIKQAKVFDAVMILQNTPILHITNLKRSELRIPFPTKKPCETATMEKTAKMLSKLFGIEKLEMLYNDDSSSIPKEPENSLESDNLVTEETENIETAEEAIEEEIKDIEESHNGGEVEPESDIANSEEEDIDKDQLLGDGTEMLEEEITVEHSISECVEDCEEKPEKPECTNCDSDGTREEKIEIEESIQETSESVEEDFEVSDQSDSQSSESETTEDCNSDSLESECSIEEEKGEVASEIIPDEGSGLEENNEICEEKSSSKSSEDCNSKSEESVEGEHSEHSEESIEEASETISEESESSSENAKSQSSETIECGSSEDKSISSDAQCSTQDETSNESITREGEDGEVVNISSEEISEETKIEEVLEPELDYGLDEDTVTESEAPSSSTLANYDDYIQEEQKKCNCKEQEVLDYDLAELQPTETLTPCEAQVHKFLMSLRPRHPPNEETTGFRRMHPMEPLLSPLSPNFLANLVENAKVRSPQDLASPMLPSTPPPPVAPVTSDNRRSLGSRFLKHAYYPAYEPIPFYAPYRPRDDYYYGPIRGYGRPIFY